MNSFVNPAQMVNRLLGQGGRSSGAQAEASALSAVSPGDIGIICFHRAQVGGFGLSCSCHGLESAVCGEDICYPHVICGRNLVLQRVMHVRAGGFNQKHAARVQQELRPRRGRGAK